MLGLRTNIFIFVKCKYSEVKPNSKVHEAYMGPTWDRQVPGGPNVGLMNLAIRECFYNVITQWYDTSYFIAFHHVVAWMMTMPERRRGHYIWRASQISLSHYNNVITGAIASQITSLMIVFSTFYSDADQRKHQSSASLAFVRGIHRGPVDSSHKWSVTRKMLPFDDVIMWHLIFEDANNIPQSIV